MRTVSISEGAESTDATWGSKPLQNSNVGTRSALHAGSIPLIWTHLGQGSFVPLRWQSWWTENADAINWIASLPPLSLLYWRIWQDCKGDPAAWCQDSFSYSFTLTCKGSLGSVSSLHHPSIFSNGQKEDWEVQVSWPSMDLNPCNILVRQEETRSKLGLFITAEVLVLSTLELWCLRCWYHTTRATDKQTVSNSDKSSDPKQLSAVLNKLLTALQFLTKPCFVPLWGAGLKCLCSSAGMCYLSTSCSHICSQSGDGTCEERNFSGLFTTEYLSLINTFQWLWESSCFEYTFDEILQLTATNFLIHQPEKNKDQNGRSDFTFLGGKFRNERINKQARLLSLKLL